MLLQIDFEGETPLFLQIHHQIVLAIARRELKNGDQLPTIRALSEELGINMMTVSKAYQRLAQEGYIVTDRHKGAVVSLCGEITGITRTRMEELAVHLAELRVHGVAEDEILLLCRQLLEEMR